MTNAEWRMANGEWRMAKTIAIVSLAFGIWHSPFAQAQAPAPAPVVVTLERTTCFGSCPAYTISIADDGTVKYEGRSYVRVAGARAWKIEPSAVAALAREMEAAGYFDLKDRYRAPITDLPTVRTSLRLGGRSKSIEDYYGAPESLHALERRVDEVAGVKKYVFIDGATLKEMAAKGWDPTGGQADALMLRAVETADADVTGTLIDLGYDVNHATPTGPIILHARGEAVLDRLLAAGAAVDTRSSRGTTPLHRAAATGDPAAVRFLLSRGANPAAFDQEGVTPLMEAANSGSAEAVRALLGAGADPAARDTDGRTAADRARDSLERIKSLKGLPGFAESPRPFEEILRLLQHK